MLDAQLDDAEPEAASAESRSTWTMIALLVQKRPTRSMTRQHAPPDERRGQSVYYESVWREGRCSGVGIAGSVSVGIVIDMSFPEVRSETP